MQKNVPTHKKNGEVVPVHIVKVCGRSRGAAPLMLISVLDEYERLNSHPARLTPPGYLLGGPQSPSGRFVEEKNIFPLTGFELWTVRPDYATPAVIRFGYG